MAPRKKISRKELLKPEDEFLTFSGRAVMYVHAHAKVFRYAGLAVAALLLVYSGVWTYFGQVDKKGQAAYNEAYYAQARTLEVKQDPEKQKGVEESFRKVIDQYSLSDAARLAYPALAHLKFIERNYSEAVPLYMGFLEKTPRESPYRPLAVLALAGCYEGMGDTDKALATLKDIASHGGPSGQLGTMSLARVYRLAGQTEKSREVLVEFAAKHKDSPLLPLVQAQLAKEPS